MSRRLVTEEEHNSGEGLSHDILLSIEQPINGPFEHEGFGFRTISIENDWFFAT